MQRLVIVFILLGCAKTQTLNTKPYRFGESPEDIVWIQMAGFTEEHLAMLRFTNKNSLTFFEEASCLGKTWTFNLYKLRPRAFESFRTQITGKKNITGRCSDFKKKPLWNYLFESGYNIGLFEAGISEKNSLEQAWDCPEGHDFKKNLIVWSMKKGKKRKKERGTFHFQEKTTPELGVFHYDKSCQNTSCFTDISGNIKSIYPSFHGRSGDSFFLLRDYTYQNSLKKKNFPQSKKILDRLNDLIKYFHNELKGKKSLLLITSAASIGLEFPRQGREWFEFDQMKPSLLYRRPGLMSPVLVWGSGAEHFCGIYEESEIFTRLLSSFR